MNIAKSIRLAGCVAAVVCVASSAAVAAPTITEAFLANVGPNVTFLEQSSQLALDHSSSARLRSYAQGEISETTRMADALGSVSQPTELAAATSMDGMATGRSVALDNRDGGLGRSANGRAALGTTDAADLAKLTGRKFLDAYWLKQVDALSQLRADYQDYAANGDEERLVALSRRELKTIERRLELLTRI